MKTLLSLALVLFLVPFSLTAQKVQDIVGSDKPITWLGLDFTMAKFIGPAMQYRDAGEITDVAFRDKYVPGWNDLFINEQNKYDVAKYVNRESVKFAMDVTAKNNNKLRSGIFSDDPNDFSRLTESDISKAVRKYDFQGQKGVGLIIFIEGMSKGREQARGWITFVDMNTKTVLQMRGINGKAGGFGFRNYWAKAFLNILKEADSR